MTPYLPQLKQFLKLAYWFTWTRNCPYKMCFTTLYGCNILKYRHWIELNLIELVDQVGICLTDIFIRMAKYCVGPSRREHFVTIPMSGLSRGLLIPNDGLSEKEVSWKIGMGIATAGGPTQIWNWESSDIRSASAMLIYGLPVSIY